MEETAAKESGDRGSKNEKSLRSGMKNPNKLPERTIRQLQILSKFKLIARPEPVAPHLLVRTFGN